MKRGSSLHHLLPLGKDMVVPFRGLKVFRCFMAFCLLMTPLPGYSQALPQKGLSVGSYLPAELIEGESQNRNQQILNLPEAQQILKGFRVFAWSKIQMNALYINQVKKCLNEAIGELSQESALGLEDWDEAQEEQKFCREVFISLQSALKSYHLMRISLALTSSPNPIRGQQFRQVELFYQNPDLRQIWLDWSNFRGDLATEAVGNNGSSSVGTFGGIENFPLYQQLCDEYHDRRRTQLFATCPCSPFAIHGRPLVYSDFMSHRLSHIFNRYDLQFYKDRPQVPTLTGMSDWEAEETECSFNSQVWASIQQYYYTSPMRGEYIEQFSTMDALRESRWDLIYEDQEQSQLSDFLRYQLMNFQNTQKESYFQQLEKSPVIAFLSVPEDLYGGPLDQLLNIKRLDLEFLPQEEVRDILDRQQKLLLSLRDAYENILTINRSYAKAFVDQFDDKVFDARKYLTLLSMGPLFDEFVRRTRPDETISNALREEFGSLEMNRILTEMAVYFGLAMGCYVTARRIPGMVRLAQSVAPGLMVFCSFSSGFGASAIFYMLSNSRYERAFEQFFSGAGEGFLRSVEDGVVFEELMALQKAEIVSEIDSEVAFEYIFAFIGSGVPEVIRLLSSGARKSIQNFRVSRGLQ